MKIRILSSAIQDLHDARLFYDRQGEDLARTFH